jgi:hypothetical protein
VRTGNILRSAGGHHRARNEIDAAHDPQAACRESERAGADRDRQLKGDGRRLSSARHAAEDGRRSIIADPWREPASKNVIAAS